VTEDSGPFGREVVVEILQRRLQVAASSYEQIINRLWAGNGAGVVATLAAIGTGKASSAVVFVVLLMFTVGIMLLAIMAICSLFQLASELRTLERIDSVLQMPMNLLRKPSEDIGLSIYDCRAIIAGLSALMFLAGTGLGLFEVAHMVGFP